MENFLNDKVFLQKINRHKHRIYYAKISLLDFATEKIVGSLEGKVTGGSMSISASSATRRTGSLTIIFDSTTRNITETSNLIAIDKKIDIQIGISNPFYQTEDYSKYGQILWFKQGVFFITSASSNITTTSASVSIQFIDKMGGLNGVCGGVFPASTNLHEILTTDENGDTSYTNPLIKDIISEMVHHYGNESYSRILIEDLEDVGREIVTWQGETPIWFYTPNGGPPNGTFEITEEDKGSNWTKYLQGEIIGYMETELTYPGELIMDVGSTVSSALQKIADTLGNYEFFYDTEGIFHFRKKRNFENTGSTPLNLYLDTNDTLFQSLYSPIYNSNSYLSEFLDNELVISLSYSPNYSNIKNDWVCWGSGASSSSGDSNNTNTWVRYHLAIDKRPTEIPLPTPGTEEVKWIGNNYSLCHKDIYPIKSFTNGEKTDYDTIVRYEAVPIGGTPQFDPYLEYCGAVIPALDSIADITEKFNWREELYRRALVAYGNSTEGSYYDEELLAEWRKLFDPSSADFKSEWTTYVTSKTGEAWQGYNPQIIYAPDKIDYWLDFIDANSQIGKFSVERIGRRTSASVNSTVSHVFSADIPDVVFIKNTGNKSDAAQMEIAEKIKYYTLIGQTFGLFNPDQWDYLQVYNDNGSCYELARQALYDGIVYNSSVNLTCIPILYLDVNNIILLNQVDLGVKGNYVINTISWQLKDTKQMTLGLQEAVVVA